MSWFAKAIEMATHTEHVLAQMTLQKYHVFCVVALTLSTSEIPAEALHVYSCFCPSFKYMLDIAIFTVTPSLAQDIEIHDT